MENHNESIFDSLKNSKIYAWFYNTIRKLEGDGDNFWHKTKPFWIVCLYILMGVVLFYGACLVISWYILKWFLWYPIKFIFGRRWLKMQPVEKPKRMHKILEGVKDCAAWFWNLTEGFWCGVWQVICFIGRMLFGLLEIAGDVLEILSFFTW